MSGPGIGRPRFVTTDDAIAFHAIALAQCGGAPGLRDHGLLDSALSMAKQGFDGEYAHKFPFEMAAAHAFHLARNHPFVDGNKRVALACCVAFLRMNGWNTVSEGVEAADCILALIEGSLDKAGFASWLPRHARQRPMIELRDFFQLIDLPLRGEQFRAMSMSPRPPEVASTIDEARRAIPAIGAAWAGVMNARAVGDEAAARVLEQHATLLTALFRLAEDMGYEW